MKTEYSQFNRPLIKVILLLTISLGLFSCGSDNSSNSHADLPPIAKAVVIGAPLINNKYMVLAGSDILISAKDSDGIDDPILQFNWSATSSSDASLTLSQIEASLIERTNTTKLFRAPAVKQSTQVTFELTVIDGDGRSATDSIDITINPFAKTKAFLNTNAINNTSSNQYELVVALALEPNEVTASTFEVLIETLAQWKPRSADDSCQFGKNHNQCQLVINAQTLNGEWPPQLDYDETNDENVATAYFNPHFLIDIPAIDTDIINKKFEDSNRHKRLELHQVNSAFLTQRFSFISADNTARLLILNNARNDDSGLLNHTSTSVDSTTVKVDDLRNEKNIESYRSATAYYQFIDPSSELDTLEKWRNQKGFNDISSNASSINHAIYTNNYDLGFGRDMFMRTDNCGNVYSYVDNYPTLENAIQKRNNFATVVMEYSGLLPEDNGSCAQGDKFVKFYAYVPDKTTGDMVRATSMNFDGRGEKFMPGVCTSCHGGTTNNVTQYIAGLASPSADNSEINALTDSQKLAIADLNSTFMPFDLDAFLYTNASDINLVDPAINYDTLTSEQVTQYARSSQQNSLRGLNKAVLHSYLHKQESLAEDDVARERWQAPIDLINTWYSSNIDSSADLDQLDQQIFNGENTLINWQSEQGIYHEVFAKYCRACHIQSSNVSINFAESEEFIDAASRITTQVYNDYNMPMARLTSDRFWLNFNGTTSAAAILQTFLEGHEQSIEAFTGLPTAAFNITDTVSNTIVNTIDEINHLIEFDASTSLLADNYLWSMTNDCASDEFLNNNSSIQASMINDASPCNYVITLDVSNFFGQDSLIKTFIVDRNPEAVDITVLVNNRNTNLPASENVGAESYTPGNSALTIDINAEIVERGDNVGNNLDIPMQLIITDPTVDDLFVNNNDDGTVTVSFPPLSGIEGEFDYQVADFNGSTSDANDKGTVSFTIKAIIPTLSQANITISSVQLNWQVPADFTADSYNLMRSGTCASCTETFTNINGSALSYQDNGLIADTSYQYILQAVIGDDSSESTALDVTTISGKPSGLVLNQAIESLTLTWDMASDANHTGFEIYRSANDTGANLASITSLAKTARSYTDQNLTANSHYSYKVRAFYASSNNQDSTLVSKPTLMAKPTNLTISNKSETSALLTWQNDNGTNDLCYLITNGSSPVEEQCEDDVTLFQYQFNNLTTGTTYQVTLQAKGIDGNKSAIASTSYNTNAVVTPPTSFINDVYTPFSSFLTNCSTSCHDGTSAQANAAFDTSNMSAPALLSELKSGATYSRLLNCVENGCDSAATGSMSASGDVNDTRLVEFKKWIGTIPLVD